MPQEFLSELATLITPIVQLILASARKNFSIYTYHHLIPISNVPDESSLHHRIQSKIFVISVALQSEKTTVFSRIDCTAISKHRFNHHVILMQICNDGNRHPITSNYHLHIAVDNT